MLSNIISHQFRVLIVINCSDMLYQKKKKSSDMREIVYYWTYTVLELEGSWAGLVFSILNGRGGLSLERAGF